MTIPWGTTRHQHFFFFLLTMGIKHLALFSSLGPAERRAQPWCIGPAGHVGLRGTGATSSCPRAGAALRGTAGCKPSVVTFTESEVC